MFCFLFVGEKAQVVGRRIAHEESCEIMDETRALLDELMGVGRNGDSGNRLKITDSKVCRSYLCGFCPQQMFTNTKAAMGE